MRLPGHTPIRGHADGLAAVVALQELAGHREDAEVEGAVRASWSWSQAAEALGVTRQVVHRKRAKRLIAGGIDLGRRMDEVNVPMTTRDALKQARELASKLNSRTVEAEHLLVVPADPWTETATILQEAGLDPSRIEVTLRQGNWLSLAVAGVETLTNDKASASIHSRTPQWGASAKAALARVLHLARGSERAPETTTDLLVGILQAELGTVPRTLAIAGTDRTELLARIGESR
jgi:hypothetical protein